MVQTGPTASAQPRRVVVVGGESTGKSTLVTALADHFGCPTAAEFARDYLSEHGAAYGLATSWTLARGQADREDAAVAQALADGSPLVICDTDPLTTMLWAEYYFKDHHPRVEALLPTLTHDLHLLCTPDGLAWYDDGLRRSPDSREWFTRRLEDELTARGMRFLRLDVPLDERTAAAAAAIERLLAESDERS